VKGGSGMTTMYARIFVFIGALASTVALAACSNTMGSVEADAGQAISRAAN
jgi:predicted small secreted protein